MCGSCPCPPESRSRRQPLRLGNQSLFRGGNLEIGLGPTWSMQRCLRSAVRRGLPNLNASWSLLESKECCLFFVECKLRYVANHGPTGLLNRWKSDLVNNRRMLIARLNFGSQALDVAQQSGAGYVFLSVFYLWKCRGGYEKR